MNHEKNFLTSRHATVWTYLGCIILWSTHAAYGAESSEHDEQTRAGAPVTMGILREHIKAVTGSGFNGQNMTNVALYNDIQQGGSGGNGGTFAYSATVGNATLGTLVNSSTMGNLALGSLVNDATVGNETLGALVYDPSVGNQTLGSLVYHASLGNATLATLIAASYTLVFSATCGNETLGNITSAFAAIAQASDLSAGGNIPWTLTIDSQSLLTSVADDTITFAKAGTYLITINGTIAVTANGSCVITADGTATAKYPAAGPIVNVASANNATTNFAFTQIVTVAANDTVYYSAAITTATISNTNLLITRIS